jgi:hypothetical protein
MVATEVGYLVVAGALCSIGLAAKRALTHGLAGPRRRRRLAVGLVVNRSMGAPFGDFAHRAHRRRGYRVCETAACPRGCVVAPGRSPTGQGVRGSCELRVRRRGFPLG